MAQNGSEHLRRKANRQLDIGLTKGFKNHMKINNYTTLQPQTKEHLKYNDLTSIDFEKMDAIKNIAVTLRGFLDNKHKYKIFDITMIEYYNSAGIIIDTINRGEAGSFVEHFVKYKDIVKTNEEKALLATLIIDPNLTYYHTYQQHPEDPIKTIKAYYGFVSKELLEIERLYDFIERYRNAGKAEESIKYLAKKMYNPESRGHKR